MKAERLANAGAIRAAILDLDSKQVNFLSLDAAHWKY